MVHVLPISGQIFTYREKSRVPFRSRVGVGQVLGTDEQHGIVYVRLFDASGDELKSFVGFLPILRDAYQVSDPHVVKLLGLPSDWEPLRDEWWQKWKSGEAGVFSRPLNEVTSDTLDTVDHLRDFTPEQGAFIELAYPKRSGSGEFDTIAAYVGTAK